MSFQNCKVVSKGTNPLDYHNQIPERGTPEFFMSPSSLREFARCPRRWKDGYNPPDSDAKDDGNLVDCVLLTPHQFVHKYAVRPSTYKNEDGEEKAFNLNATVCKKWVKDQGEKEVITAVELANCNESIRRLRQDETIAAWLDACDNQVCVAGRWVDEETGITVPVRCLMDFVPRLDTEFYKCLGDFKRTRNAGLSAWSRWCFQAGYHIQAAFDTDIYVKATGEDRVNWCFVVQENFPPWQPGKRMLSTEHGLDFGRLEYQRMLKLYCQCLKSGIWPDYDSHDEVLAGGWSLVSAEPFMESRLMFAPKMVVEPEPEPENDDEITP